MKMRFEYDREIDLLYVYYTGRKYAYSENHNENEDIIIAKDKDDKVIALELLDFVAKHTGTDECDDGKLLKPLTRGMLWGIYGMLKYCPDLTDIFIVEYCLLERQWCFKSTDNTTIFSKAESLHLVLKDLKENFWLPEELGTLL